MHHCKQHPEQDFVEYVPLDYEPPQEYLEDWEIAPKEGLLELGSPVYKDESGLYSPISSGPLISENKRETFLEVDFQDVPPSKMLL